MIINIPLQIDEAALEKQLSVDYENKVNTVVEKIIRDSLAGVYSWRTSDDAVRNGMREAIRDRVDHYIEDNREEILDAVVARLYERTHRTKKVKDVEKGE